MCIYISKDRLHTDVCGYVHVERCYRCGHSFKAFWCILSVSMKLRPSFHKLIKNN